METTKFYTLSTEDTLTIYWEKAAEAKVHWRYRARLEGEEPAAVRYWPEESLSQN